MADEPKDQPAKPKIDFSAALGEAGHEVKDQGWEDVPDDGSTTDGVHEHQDAEERAAALDAAVERGAFEQS